VVAVARRTLVALSALVVLTMAAPSAQAAGRDSAIPGTSDGTIEFWGYATDLDSRNGVVYTADDGTSTHSHQIGVRPDGSVRIYLWDGSRRTADTAPGLITPNTWHHYALVWSDGATADLYVDGTKRASVAIGSSWKDGDKLLFGHAAHDVSGLPNPWQGRIDEAAVYNQALPADTIQQHHESARATHPPNQVTVSTSSTSDSAISTALRILLAVAALGAALAALSYLALRHSLATLALLLAVWVAMSAVRDSIDLSVVVSGVRVSALDVVSVVLAGVGVARIISDGVQNIARALALALFLLLAFHAARGVAEFGMEGAANGARGALYFISPLLYAATMPGGWDRRAWRMLAATGVLLAAIAVPYFVIEGLGSASSQIVRDGVVGRATPITAAGALLILQAAILLPVLRWPSRQTAMYAAFGAGALVLLLQHRTVWAAALLIAMVGFVWSVRKLDRDEVAYLAVGAGLLVVPLAVLAFTQVGPLGESLESVTRSDSTFNWRVDGWSELLSTHDSPAELTTGQPAGAAYHKDTDNDVSPHNNFVDTYIRFGLPGVLCLLWLGLLLWFKRSEIGPATGLTPDVAGLLILALFVFSIGYQLDSVQGLIAGIFVAGVATATVRAPAVLPSAAGPRVAMMESAGSGTGDRSPIAAPRISRGDRQGLGPVSDDR
jgi:hypothetical protein